MMSKPTTLNPFSAGNRRAIYVERKTNRPRRDAAHSRNASAAVARSRDGEANPRARRFEQTNHPAGSIAPARTRPQRGRPQFFSGAVSRQIEKKLLKLKPRLREKLLRLAYFLAGPARRRNR